MSKSVVCADPAADESPWKKTPKIVTDIKVLLEHDTAGDPITGLKWSRRTPGKIAYLLDQVGICVSSNTVARLLHQMNYSVVLTTKCLPPILVPAAISSLTTSPYYEPDSIGVAIPYGIYDLLANRGSIFVGVSHDTPASQSVRSPAGGPAKVSLATLMPANSSS